MSYSGVQREESYGKSSTLYVSIDFIKGELTTKFKHFYSSLQLLQKYV